MYNAIIRSMHCKLSPVHAGLAWYHIPVNPVDWILHRIMTQSSNILPTHSGDVGREFLTSQLVQLTIYCAGTTLKAINICLSSALEH